MPAAKRPTTNDKVNTKTKQAKNSTLDSLLPGTTNNTDRERERAKKK